MPNSIKQMREFRGLSQQELADRLGMSDSAVSRLENGRRRLTTEIAKDIARVLGVAVGDLLGEPEADVAFREHYIEVRGTAGSDRWFTQEPKQETSTRIPVLPGGKHAQLYHAAHKIEDNHASDLTSAGSYVITVPYQGARRSVVDGDWVLARQTEGRVARMMVCRARRDALAKYVLDAPDGQIKAGDDNEIIGLVVATYNLVE